MLHLFRRNIHPDHSTLHILKKLIFSLVFIKSQVDLKGLKNTKIKLKRPDENHKNGHKQS